VLARKIQKGYTLIFGNFFKEKENEIFNLFQKELRKCIPFDILCPTYLDKKGLIFYSGGGITPNEFLPYPDGQAELDIKQYPKPRIVDFSPLWAFVIRNDILKKVKPLPVFDKNIYTHADFCVKVRKMGYKIKVTSDIKLTHTKIYTLIKEEKKWIKILSKSKNEFIKKHSKWLDSQYKLPVVFHSHTGFPGGYCLHARNLLKTLHRKKIKLFYKFVGGTNDDEPLANDFLVDDLRVDMGDLSLPQVVLSTGLNCFSNSGKYKIGYTTTEVDGIPENWVKVLNDMDEVWATSKFAKRSFIRSGVKRPIFVMPEGVDPNYYHPGIKAFENNTNRKFLFISNFAWGRRKGVEELFEAFSKEFSATEDVALVIKALPSYHGHDIKEEMTHLYHRPDSAPIFVWDTTMEPYLIGGLYTAGNCFVFPSRGEGFGLPPLEALACGIPVITTGYSAPIEYLMKNNKPLPGVELIKYKIKKFDGRDSVYYWGFNWAVPSVSHLRHLMRKVYNNYKKYKEGAMQSSEYIRKTWSWDRKVDLVIKRLKFIYQNKLK